MRKCIVPAAKRVGADLLEFDVPEIAEVVTGRKSIKTAARSVGRQTLRKQLGSGSRKLSGSRIVPTKSAKQFSRSRRDFFYKHFALFISSNLRYQTFVAVSGNLGGKVPIVGGVLSSHEQGIYPSTLLDKNCIEFEFLTDRNYYVDFRQTNLALKLKHVRGRVYGTYTTKEVKREHKEEAKAEEEKTVEEEAPVPLVTHVNNILHSILSIVEVYINNQQNYSSNGLYAQKAYISNNFKGAIS